MATRLARTAWKNRATQSAWRAASWTLLGLMLLMGLAGCANQQISPGTPGASAGKNSTLKGTAKFLERTVLPANSIFEATLEEVGLAGFSPNVISTDSRAVPGVSVVNFSIQFAESQIRPGRRYVVRGRVLINGQLLFVTEQPMAVLAGPQNRAATITLIRPTVPSAQTAVRTPSRAQGNTADTTPPPPAIRPAEQKADLQTSRKEAQARAQELVAARAQVAAQAQADAQSQARAQTRARAEAQAQATTQFEAKASTDARAQAQAQVEAQARAQADAQAQAQADVLARAQAQAQAQARAQAQAQAQAQVQVQAQAQAQAQADAQAQAQAQVKSQADAQAADALAKAQAQAVPAPASVAMPASPAISLTPSPAPVVIAMPAAVAPPPISAPAVVAAPAQTPRTPNPEPSSRPSDQTAIWRGLYRFAADKATFEDCASGERLPVAQEGANVVLEQAYFRLFSAGAGNPGVLATVAGRVLPRLAPDGRQQRNTLVVDGFISLGGDACPPEVTAVPVAAKPNTRERPTLENMRWKLEQLNQQPVEAIEKDREPNIVLQSASRRVTGSGSCNQLLLGYALESSTLRFTEGVVTARTCDTGMQQERAFLAALATVTSFNMEARTLRLLDAQGRVIAQFRSDEI